MYINVAVQYIRPKQSFYIRESLGRLILEVVETDELDLEVDPSIVRSLQLPLPLISLVTRSLEDLSYQGICGRDAEWRP